MCSSHTFKAAENIAAFFRALTDVPKGKKVPLMDACSETVFWQKVSKFCLQGGSYELCSVCCLDRLTLAGSLL